MAKIIDGKLIAGEVRARIADEAETSIKPALRRDFTRRLFKCPVRRRRMSFFVK